MGMTQRCLRMIGNKVPAYLGIITLVTRLLPPFLKIGQAFYMATHILIRTVPVSGSTFSLVFLYGKSHTPYSSYFVCGEDRSLLIHKKYEACDFSVLTFPKMI